MTSNAQIGERLKEVRSALGKTQQQMADALGVRREMWARYEAGAMPGGDALARLAELEVDIGYVLTGQRTAVSSYLVSNAVAEHIAAGRQTAVGAHAKAGSTDEGAPGDGTLTAEERALLDNFRACSPEGRTAIKTTSAALAQSTGLKKKTG